MKKIKNIWYLFGPLILGLIISFLIKDSIDYNYLVQPKFAPPSWLFGIVWTILYLLMGISYYLYKRDLNDTSIGNIYYTQLILNLMWPIIFFNLKMRLVGTIDIILLDIAVMYMIYRFFKEKKISAYLNMPYLIWILFATYLSYSVFLLN